MKFDCFKLALPSVFKCIVSRYPLEVLFKHQNKLSQHEIVDYKLLNSNKYVVSISDFNFNHLFRTVGKKSGIELFLYSGTNIVYNQIIFDYKRSRVP